MQRLSCLENLRLISGKEGLERTVTAAVLFEYDPSRVMLPDFYEGDLVITTLAYARGDPHLVDESLSALLHQRIAGLLVKTAYFSSLSSEVLALADETRTPIYMFDNTYIEEVLLQVTDLIRGKSRFNVFEKEIQEFMQGGLTRTQVRERLINMGITNLERYCIFAIYPEGWMGEYEKAIIHFLERDEMMEKKYRFMEAGQMIFGLVRMDPEEDAYTEKTIQQLMHQIGIESADVGMYSLGISNVFEDPYSLGNAFCEASVCAKAAKYRGEPAALAENIGMDAYLFTMVENPFLVYRCRLDLERLRKYDQQYHACLEETARIYIEKNLDIVEVASEMYQHTNTIRYRLRKIRKIINADSEGLFNAMLYTMIRLTFIIEKEKLD